MTIPYTAILFTCGRTQSEDVADPLVMFELSKEYEYLSGLGADRIIMMITRTEKDKFNYRIELMKNYYGLPLDQGTVTLTHIEQDSTMNFEGGNETCELKLKMYQSKEPSGGKRIIIERTCSDTTKNITSSDFTPLWRRGEPH